VTSSSPPIRPKYAWLLFDADGTLFDYEKAEASALEKAFAEIGERFEPLLLQTYRQINHDIWQAFERRQITAERLRLRRFELLFEALQLEVSPERFSALYLRHLAAGTHLVDGAHEVVAALHGTYRLAIVTNGLKDVQSARLAGSAIGRYFATVVISEEVGAVKPDRAFFEATFDRLGRPPKAEVLLVGDSVSSDIEGGVNYGLDTCWFNPGRQSRPPGLSCTYEIGQLSELAQLLL